MQAAATRSEIAGVSADRKQRPCPPRGQPHLLAAAQVHATLALTAATENARPRRALPRPGRASLVARENKLVKPPLPGVGNRLYRPD